MRRELPLLLLATCILVVMTLDRALQYHDPILSRGDGVILFLLFSIFIYVSVNDFLRSSQDKVIKDVIEMEQTIPGNFLDETTQDWLLTGAGIVSLACGGHLTIVNGSTLAAEIGVSPTVIGLLVVAIGTSMPELATSIIAAVRNEADLCVGNVVGSNIFNSLFVLPASALIRPLPIPEGVPGDIVLSLVFAAVLIPIFVFGQARMSRYMGGLFLALYAAYMVYRAAF